MDSSSSSGGKKDGHHRCCDVEHGHVQSTRAGVVDKGKRRAQSSCHSQDEQREANEETPLIYTPSATQSYSRLSRSRTRPQGVPSTSTSAIQHASGIHSSSSSSRSASHNRNSLYRTLFKVFITTLWITVVTFLLVLAVAWSYAAKAASMEPERIIEEGVVVKGPETVDVVNVTSRGVWVDVSGRVGVDAAGIIGVKRGSTDQDGVLKSLWKAVGRWGVEKVGTAGVRMEGIEIWSVYGGDEDDESREEVLLMKLIIPPLVVPLSVDAPATIRGDSKQDEEWLTPFSTRVFVQPAVDTKHLLKFLKHSWQTQYVGLKTRVKVTNVRLGCFDSTGGVGREWPNNSSWLSRLMEKTLKNVIVGIRFRLPSLPGFPHPGHNIPFPSLSQLLTLTSFSARSDGAKGLVLDATATVINPAPEYFHFTAPSLPFIISIPNIPLSPNTSLSLPNPSPELPASYPLASIHTSPINLETHPNITLSVTGRLLPISDPLLSLLSTFISRYLSSKPNPILIAPTFLPAPLDSLQIPVDFPAPAQRPRVLRDVSIRDMRIKPGGVGDKAPWLASGVVVARVVLPPGFNIDLDVKSVFPDVIIFDGEVPEEPTDDRDVVDVQRKRRGRHDDDDEDENDVPPPPEMPLPDPLPERAFAHLRPEDWVDAVSGREDDGGDGDDGKVKEVVYAVSAKVVDVPLEVLPGRQKEFRSFVSKVIFGSEGATAGLLGQAAVLVSVQGLPIVSKPSRSNKTRHGDTGTEPKKDPEVMLQGLPFRGSVKVGKKSRLGVGFGVGNNERKEGDWWDELRKSMEWW